MMRMVAGGGFCCATDGCAKRTSGAVNAKLYEFKVVRAPAGFDAQINISTGATGWNNALILKLFSAPGVELAAGAYPAPILADSFDVELSGPNGSF